MPELPPLPSVKEIITQTELRADKKFGQNFLLDTNITDKIVRCAGHITDHHVIEIGPGPGGLSRSILSSDAKDLTAIEFDPRAVKTLSYLQEAAPNHFNLIEGDALALNMMDVAPAPRSLIANLPYNVATPLLIGWLEQIATHGTQAYSSMTLMFQKEVADRIVAAPSTKAYGRLSILSQWLCDVQMKYVLPAEAFSPPPKVKSAIVHFRPKQFTAPKPNFKTIERITEAAFGQRRKMIRQSLKTYMQDVENIGLTPTLRAENLTIQDYINLAKSAEANQSV